MVNSNLRKTQTQLSSIEYKQSSSKIDPAKAIKEAAIKQAGLHNKYSRFIMSGYKGAFPRDLLTPTYLNRFLGDSDIDLRQIEPSKLAAAFSLSSESIESLPQHNLHSILSVLNDFNYNNNLHVREHLSFLIQTGVLHQSFSLGSIFSHGQGSQETLSCCLMFYLGTYDVLLDRSVGDFLPGRGVGYFPWTNKAKTLRQHIAASQPSGNAAAILSAGIFPNTPCQRSTA